MADPLTSLDGIMNSGAAALINFGTDFYEGHVSRQIAESMDPGKTLPSDVQGPLQKNQTRSLVGSEQANEFDRYRRAASNQYNSRNHWIRNKLTDEKSIFSKIPGRKFFISDPKDLINERASRRYLASNTTFNPKKAYAGMHDYADRMEYNKLVGKGVNARALRSFGTVAFGVSAASLTAGLTKSFIDSAISRGHRSGVTSTGFAQDTFLDSNMAYTSRQRALRAIQNSQSGMRRALGNEASFLHSYR